MFDASVLRFIPFNLLFSAASSRVSDLYNFVGLKKTAQPVVSSSSQKEPSFRLDLSEPKNSDRGHAGSSSKYVYPRLPAELYLSSGPSPKPAYIGDYMHMQQKTAIQNVSSSGRSRAVAASNINRIENLVISGQKYNERLTLNEKAEMGTAKGIPTSKVLRTRPSSASSQRSTFSESQSTHQEVYKRPPVSADSGVGASRPSSAGNKKKSSGHKATIR